MENLPPFGDQPSLTEQIAHFQRNDIEGQLRDVAKELSAVTVSMARQEEWRLAVSASMIANAVTISTLAKDVSEIKDLASRYKGGLYVVLGLSGFCTGLFVLWDKIVAKFH